MPGSWEESPGKGFLNIEYIMSKIKCLVWDLDNTMWNGVLLENDQLRLKPGIEAIIKELDNRGILQSIASKNNYEEALSLLDKFGVKEYFLYPQVSWQSKSHSIKAIQEALNIGIDTIAFIDDDAFEREEVNSAHPKVRCFDALDYQTLLDNTSFQPDFITEDSKLRRIMYLHDDERKRKEEAFEGPKEEFLRSLSMELFIRQASEDDLQRAAELTLRTNQLNTTGITYDYDDLNYFRMSGDHRLYICELKDKFGSYGKIGLILLEETPEALHIKLFLMSCRVMTRGVGTVLLSFLMKQARQAGKRLFADFRRTDRNRLMFVTYKFAGFTEHEVDGDQLVLENRLENIQEYPDYMKLSFSSDVNREASRFSRSLQ
jgi:FkbH-like protein